LAPALHQARRATLVGAGDGGPMGRDNVAAAIGEESGTI